jgi:IclR family pca regulon transcriptional regulator
MSLEEELPSRPGSVPLIQAVERALRILELFTAERPVLTLADLTDRTGMSKGTVHRYAVTLRHIGLLRYVDGVYTLGPKALEFSSAALAGLGVVQMGGPYLVRLLAQTGQTSVLSVWEGDSPVVVRVEDNTRRTARVVVTPGSRLDAASAQAQVFLAFKSPTTQSLRLKRVQTARLAFHAGPDGIAALAAPVFQNGQIVATLALVGTSVMIDGGAGSGMARALSAIAAELSANLGKQADGQGVAKRPAKTDQATATTIRHR